MLDNISFNRFYNIDSEIRNMNPISKILCVMIFLILTFLESSIKFNLILVGILVLIMFFSKIPFKVYLKIVLSLLSFIIFIFLITFLCKTSINQSILFSIRLILIVLYSSVLTMTTTPSELVYGLEHILSPLKIFKVPVSSLALILSLAIRFIPTVFDECKKIVKAYECRGINFKSLKLKQKLLYLKSIIVPMFILSIKNSDEVADNFSLKLYDSNVNRTELYVLPYTKVDAYMLCFHFMLVMMIVVKGF